MKRVQFTQYSTITEIGIECGLCSPASVRYWLKRASIDPVFTYHGPGRPQQYYPLDTAMRLQEFMKSNRRKYGSKG